MDTLLIIIITGLVAIVVLVLIVYNSLLHNRITESAVENDRLKRENHSLEKENRELSDELEVVTGGKKVNPRNPLNPTSQAPIIIENNGRNIQ